MNLIEAQCDAVTDNDLSITLGGHKITVPAEQFVERPKVGSTVTLGFRPRAVRPRTSDGLNFSGSTAIYTENMGAKTLVHSAWNGFSLRMLVPGNDFSEGDKLDLSIASASLSLFGDGGQRLAMKSDKETA
jgi:ABC-type sugar transport system ATPase subunit